MNPWYDVLLRNLNFIFTERAIFLYICQKENMNKWVFLIGFKIWNLTLLSHYSTCSRWCPCSSKCHSCTFKYVVDATALNRVPHSCLWNSIQSYWPLIYKFWFWYYLGYPGKYQQKVLSWSYQKVLNVFSDNYQDFFFFLKWCLYNLLPEVSTGYMLSGHVTKNNYCVSNDNLPWLAWLAVLVRCHWYQTHILVLEMLVCEKREYLRMVRYSAMLWH